MKRSEALDMIEQGLAALRTRTDKEAQSPVSVFSRLCMAGVTLRTGGDISRGGAHYYMTMPRGWTPSDGTGWWMFNTDGGYYWTSEWAPTKSDAELRGIARLCNVMLSVQPPYERKGVSDDRATTTQAQLVESYAAAERARR